jgi:Lon protease-like protein
MMAHWSPEQFEFDDAGFEGTARLFPLPDLVLFPHVMQPLHVFEPRYRAMVSEALATDRLIAVVRLEPGWEADYEGRPPVASVACLGKIVSEHRLEDGRFNILLLGLRRIEIVGEVATPRPFRTAQARILHDGESPDAGERKRLIQDLLESFRRTLPTIKGVKDTMAVLLKKNVSLGVLTDLIAFATDFDGHIKQSLLAETNVLARAKMLLERLAADGPHGRAWPKGLGGFPPSFSAN